MAVEIARRWITIDEYHAMFEHGILTEPARVELIAGEVIEMPPIGPPHGSETLAPTAFPDLLLRASEVLGL